MKQQRLKVAALSAAISIGAALGGVAQAASVNSILNVGESKTKLAQSSQQRIDTIADQTANLLGDFKIVNKQIEGLRVYNAQLQKQLAGQLETIKQLEKSIADITVIERQVQPLILRMLDGLNQFVSLDVPFYAQERKDRVEMLRNNQERTDITVAEKFRQVLEAYEIEIEYGRKVNTYEDTLNIDGQDREVNVLHVGRVALMYQTKDGKSSGAWDKNQGAWVTLDSGDYRTAIRDGIKIAKKQASIGIMNLPVLAPEAAQ